jgi:hypothetical protein
MRDAPVAHPRRSCCRGSCVAARRSTRACTRLHAPPDAAGARVPRPTLTQMRVRRRCVSPAAAGGRCTRSARTTRTSARAGRAYFCARARAVQALKRDAPVAHDCAAQVCGGHAAVRQDAPPAHRARAGARAARCGGSGSGGCGCGARSDNGRNGRSGDSRAAAHVAPAAAGSSARQGEQRTPHVRC